MCVLLVFFFSVRYSVIKDHLYPIARYEMVKDKPYFLFEDFKEKKAEGKPFLIDGIIVYETGDQVAMNVHYYVPEGDRRTYSITMYPQKNNFYNEKNTLELGENVLRISVNFESESLWRKWEYTKFTTIYLNEVLPDGRLKVVYARRMLYPKSWKKKATQIQAVLQGSRFYNQ